VFTPFVVLRLYSDPEIWDLLGSEEHFVIDTAAS